MGLVLEFWGRGAGGEKGGAGSPGLPLGVCDPLQPARVWAFAEGAGGAVIGARVAMGRPGEIWVSQEAISGPISNRWGVISNPTWLLKEPDNLQAKQR